MNLNFKQIIIILTAFLMVACSDVKETNELQLTQQSLEEIVDKRIEVYVERMKQAAIAERLKPYELASEVVDSGKHIYGSLNARFTLVEYSDLECPFCKSFHSTPKNVVDYSGGLVNWEFVHFPLPMHNPVAFIEAQASECVSELAGNRAFWAFIGLVFDNTKGNGQQLPNLASIGSSLGVDDELLLECVRSGRYKEKVQKSVDDGTKVGITGTPTTIIVDNHTGQVIPLNAQASFDSINAAIQSAQSQ